MKRIIFNIIAITIAFLSFILWYEKSEKNPIITTTTTLDHYKVYLITTDKKSPYWYSIDEGASDMAKLLGISYKWEAPPIRNTQEQIDLVQKAVNDGADAILIAVNDPIKLSSAIADAKAQGVKIIYVDSPANEEAVITLSTNNLEAGRIAGKTMISELEGLGIKQGLLGIIGITPEYTITMQREQGFREVVDKDGRYTILETVYTNSDPTASQTAVEEMIHNNKDLVGVFGTSEGCTQGVGNAIKKLNMQIVGIGFDKSDKNVKLLKEGALDDLVIQNPYTMGYLGVSEAYAALKGFDTGPSYIDTGVSIMYK